MDLEPIPSRRDLGDTFTLDLTAETQHEHRFVSGYMSLMRCNEPLARSVYMHIHGTWTNGELSYG